jgi:DNA polymerase-1
MLELKEKRNYMIALDASHTLYRVLYMNKAKVIENPDFLTHAMLTSICYNADRFGASKSNPLIIALDSRPTWRHTFYAEHSKDFIEYKNEVYKGNRTKDPDIPWDAVFEVYNGAMEAIKKYSDFSVLKVNNTEADDIIAIATKYYKARGEQVIVVSSDKDFLQLQDEPIVNIYDPIKNIFKPKTDIERWKRIHCIQGDDGDNILPIKARVAEKTAIKMEHEIDMILQTNPSMKARYEFNRNLVDFDYIPKEIEASIIAEIEQHEHSYNAMSLIKELKKYRLVKVIENINKFKLKDEVIVTKLNSHFKSKAKIESINRTTLEDFFGN